jgi:hypothetical protein
MLAIAGCCRRRVTSRDGRLRACCTGSRRCRCYRLATPIAVTKSGAEGGWVGKVAEKRVREVQCWALGSSRNRRKGYAVENFAGALKTETIGYKVSVAREFKMEIPAQSCPAGEGRGETAGRERARVGWLRGDDGDEEDRHRGYRVSAARLM